MLEERLKLRATAYLKLVRADIWTAPPQMLKEAQNWLVAAYAASVVELAKYELTLQTDSIKEAQTLSDQMNALLPGLYKILDAMQLNEVKEIPVNFMYHDKYGWYENTHFSITKLDKDSYKLNIKGDTKILFDNPLISKHDVIEACADIIEDMLAHIRKGIDQSNVVDLKMLFVEAKKISGEQTIMSESIGKTLDIKLEDWPYTNKIAKTNRDFLSNLYDDNRDEKERLLKSGDTLKSLGDSAGPFKFSTPVKKNFTVDVMIDTKGNLNAEFKSPTAARSHTYKNINDLSISIDKSFINPFKLFMNATLGEDSLLSYLSSQFPAKAHVNIIYENVDQSKYGGLWDPSTFTLYVRPLYLNPIESAVKLETNAMDLFTKTISDMKNTVRHEMQHFAQSLASILSSGNYSNQYGLPSEKTAPFEKGTYDSSGVAKTQLEEGPVRKHEIREDPSYGLSKGKGHETEDTSVMLKHPLRDVEFQTRLSDEIAKFKEVSKMIPLGIRNRAMKIWTGELDEPLFPFSDSQTWRNFVAKHAVGGRFILSFLEHSKIHLVNLENSIKNKLNGNDKLPVNEDNYHKEMELMRQVNALVYPASFFRALKQVIDTDKDVGKSRWAKAVGSFIKEVS